MDDSNTTTSLFWYRRLCEMAIFLGILIVLIYLLLSNVKHQNNSLLPMPILVLGGVTILLGIIFRLLKPKKGVAGGWYIYPLVLVTIGTLVGTTGGAASPFIGLWFVTELMGAPLGFAGMFLPFMANAVYIVFAVMLHWFLGTTERVIVLLAVAQVPFLIGYAAHRRNVFKNIEKSSSHAEATISHLSNRLTNVSSQSEVIVQSITDGVMVVDTQGRVQVFNPAAAQMTGWDEKEALDLDYKSIIKLTTALDKAMAGSDPVQQVLATNKPGQPIDLTLTTRSEKKLLVSLVAAPITNQDGTNNGVIVIFRDITKERAEERQQAEFVSTAAHEMRTPVATIEGYLSLALNPAVAQIDDKARDYITKAHEATNHLGRLFGDLLTVSRADDGRLTNNPQIIDLVALIQQLWEGQQTKASQKQLDYQFIPALGKAVDGGKMVLPVYYANIDPDHLREVINNLIDNAIKYTKQGRVAVDVNADDANITISVQDTGLGIAKEDIPHLFQKFYRVDSSDTREIGGTGLGLYIARRIMEQSGGQIWVESELGKGSTFFLQIPRVSNDQAAVAQSNQQAAPQLATANAKP
ncbi:MAG TPA: ATP-binding protein [Candidatus Saccharimonadales bacterium]|nr:ATP-binding protein [Candidatus Saccharimonadales bacterium]